MKSTNIKRLRVRSGAKTVSVALLKFLPVLFLVFALQSVGNSQSLPSGYIHCAFEGADCLFDGTKQVWFGADTRWIKMAATNTVTCDKASFGSDPAPGTEKRCYIPQSTDSSQALPVRFTFCANEGGLCRLPEGVFTAEVRYGADTRWIRNLVSRVIKCDYVTFGADPAYGTHKKCYYGTPTKHYDINGTWKVVGPNTQWSTMTIKQTDSTISVTAAVKIDGKSANDTFQGTITDDRIFLPFFQLGATIFANGGKLKWATGPQLSTPTYGNPVYTLAGSEWELQTPVAATTALSKSADDLPLSSTDMELVMKWIATKVAADQVPYCYKQTSGNRKVPELATDQCLSSATGEAVPCYQPCPAGHPSNGKGECTGYVDEKNKWCTSPLVMVLGGNCRKPEAYGRGAGFTHFLGDPEGDCKKANPATGCVYEGLAWYPKCKPGFHSVGLNICSPDCPAGFTDQGINCKASAEVERAFEAKRVYQKPTANSYRPQVACPPGSTQYLSKLATDIGVGGCYESCKNPRDTFAGPICWQACPSQHPTACGLGCSTTTAECVWDTADKIVSPVLLAVSIATLGGSSQANQAVAGAKASSKAAKAAKLTAIFKEAGDTVDALKAGIAGTVDNFDNIKTALKISVKSGLTIKKAVNDYQREVATDFKVATTDEVAETIDRSFGPKGALKIKEQWALVHWQMREKKEGQAWFATKAVLSVLSLEPIGLYSVANAYFHPICGDDTPFPRVTKLYFD